MSRKPKKGYFVSGQFVAEGSDEDLRLKRELKGDADVSRTDLKRESAALQKLGEDLLGLSAAQWAGAGLPDTLQEALTEGRRITNFEGKRRQMQYIGKLMRKLSPDTQQAARDALAEHNAPGASETLALHLAEQWRDRLIAHEAAFAEWMEAFADTDAQQLRALTRQARKDIKPEKPGETQRHGRAYREIFQIVKATLAAQANSDDTDNESPEHD